MAYFGLELQLAPFDIVLPSGVILSANDRVAVTSIWPSWTTFLIDAAAYQASMILNVINFVQELNCVD